MHTACPLTSLCSKPPLERISLTTSTHLKEHPVILVSYSVSCPPLWLSPLPDIIMYICLFNFYLFPPLECKLLKSETFVCFVHCCIWSIQNIAQCIIKHWVRILLNKLCLLIRTSNMCEHDSGSIFWAQALSLSTGQDTLSLKSLSYIPLLHPTTSSPSWIEVSFQGSSLFSKHQLPPVPTCLLRSSCLCGKQLLIHLSPPRGSEFLLGGAVCYSTVCPCCFS